MKILLITLFFYSSLSFSKSVLNEDVIVFFENSNSNSSKCIHIGYFEDVVFGEVIYIGFEEYRSPLHRYSSESVEAFGRDFSPSYSIDIQGNDIIFNGTYYVRNYYSKYPFPGYKDKGMLKYNMIVTKDIETLEIKNVKLVEYAKKKRRFSDSLRKKWKKVFEKVDSCNK